MWLNSRICSVGMHENVYYIKTGKTGVLVDCGSEKTYLSNMEELQKDGVDLKSIAGILVSHEHFDHIGAIGRAKAELGCPVVAHKLAVDTIERGDPLITASESRFHDINEPFLACPVDEEVDEGDSITLDDLKIEVYHIPGHTPGGVAYMMEGCLFVGDTLFKNGGIGWSDVHWGSCIADHRESINKIAGLAPSMILPGHGDAFAFNRPTIDSALEKLDWLVEVGIPPTATKPANRRGTDEPRRLVNLNAARRKEDRRKVPESLRHALLYELASKNIFGFIRPRGHHHGLALFGFEGIPITRPGACTLNLEHYCEEGKAAPFLPRDVCPMHHSVRDGSLNIHFSETSDWPVESTITYRLAGENLIDVDFEFKFGRSFRRFEAFIASYFFSRVIAYVKLDTGWVRPEIKGGEQLFFARDVDGAKQVADGRWGFLGNGKLFATVDPREYEWAMLVDWNEKSKWAFVQMVDPKFCPSISTNTFAYAQDFSLVGMDVEGGQSITAKARAAYVRVDDLEELGKLYETFLEGVKSGR